MNDREKDEFERIRLVAEIERHRGLIGQYEEGLQFCRQTIEDARCAV